ncbi:MAG: HPF/RaiA family ribosome-associated protein [Devosia sp.]|nr:HPF/RaiA family ribosome-associated protein [Devosia sp.]
MSLRISGKNMDVGDALRSKAAGHFDAVVTKYFDGGYNGHLTLEPEGPGFSAQCIIHLDTGAILRSGAYGIDAVSAYELMADTIERRLRRYNRKLRSHRRHGNGEDTVEAQSYVLAAPDHDDELAEDYSPPVVAETTSSLRQMSVGEAVMELDLGQADVIMFRHAGHGGLNVVYRRADGNIGWIDPALRAN